MKPTRQQWLNAMIHIRKAHEDAIRAITLSSHEIPNAETYERLAIVGLATAADALGFTLEEKKK